MLIAFFFFAKFEIIWQAKLLGYRVTRQRTVKFSELSKIFISIKESDSICLCLFIQHYETSNKYTFQKFIFKIRCKTVYIR